MDKELLYFVSKLREFKPHEILQEEAEGYYLNSIREIRRLRKLARRQNLKERREERKKEFPKPQPEEKPIEYFREKVQQFFRG